MKKSLFLSFILSLLFISFSISVKGSEKDSTEIAWAKHIKQALANRPDPNVFSEVEAWRVLIGEKESFIVENKKLNYKNFFFLKQTITDKVSYERSSTSSKDGWWYTKTLYYNMSDWKINWNFIFVILLSIFTFLYLNINLKKEINKIIENWKKENIINNENTKKILIRNIRDKVGNIYIPGIIIILISLFLVKDNYEKTLFMISIIFSVIIRFLRTENIIDNL